MFIEPTPTITINPSSVGAACFASWPTCRPDGAKVRENTDAIDISSLWGCATASSKFLNLTQRSHPAFRMQSSLFAYTSDNLLDTALTPII